MGDVGEWATSVSEPMAPTGPGSAVDGPPKILVSCEHAGNEIPATYTSYFDSSEALEALDGHRGWDPGSLEIAEAFASGLGAPLIAQRVSRLLVECNRSLDHPRLFSEFSRRLGDVERAEVVERYWREHRERVGAAARSAPTGSTVVHVGVHTFTPVWKGRLRSTDVGLLYDPRRRGEADLVRRWRRAMSDSPVLADMRVHLNRPYRGWTDGLTTALRRELPDSRYLGIELEVSQGLIVARGMAKEIGQVAATALGSVLRTRGARSG